MSKPQYATPVDWLREEHDDQLRWVASFNSRSHSYKVQYIREHLETELTGHQPDTIIDRSMAVFNRRHVEDVYSHLGEAECFIARHERAMAVHIYLSDVTGAVVKLEPEASVTLPDFVETCPEKLHPEGVR
ncbi:hypothetical protein ACFO0N_10755 [Halobium salinum]|uniref:Uncharacterized protein n=1 Tax=Halobium salinum TaxID=1364940 RepID=A0ABD5PBY5_9EURY|nr:hypothetical protein [Halobium salinum]